MSINKKHTGSYYTPAYLADFISEKVLSFLKDRTSISILEPSVGDGSFLDSIVKFGNIKINLTAVDINLEELKKASNKWENNTADFQNIDYLDFRSDIKFSAIIGNPPYVRKNRLSKPQIALCKEIHKNEKLSETTVKNIWTTFLIKSNTHLSNDGVLAFVLPSELLQVKYAEEIREYLKKEFERIEIFTFNDLMFECKGQDTIVLFAYKKAEEKGEFFSNIDSKKNLENNSYNLKSNRFLVTSKIKWTHHFLTNDELTFLDNIKKKLYPILFYCDSKPGIVTAANDFFIISKEKEKNFNLGSHTRPIIQKGLFVKDSVVFTDNDYDNLFNNQYPSRVLCFNGETKFHTRVSDYIRLGELQTIPERYKCKKRNKWYVVPNIPSPPDGFFFKRSHNFPKLLKNEAKVLVTDTAYIINMKNGFQIEDLISSFYNSLTLVYAELEGRYYGGGVLELVPSEFKNLPLPFRLTSKNEFQEYIKYFENKKSINELLNKYDFEILNSTLNLSFDEIKRIQDIRQILMNKRMRK